MRDGPTSDPALPDPAELAERLIDAAADGSFAMALAEASAAVDRWEDGLDRLDVFRYRLLLFDVAMVSTNVGAIQHEVALRLLYGANVAGAEGWLAIRTSNRLDQIERLATSSGGIELLELLAYAEDDGMRSFAVTQIERAGLRLLDAWVDCRPVERLLHAIGASDEAYRLEAARKQRLAGVRGRGAETEVSERRVSFRVVAIAGGHAQLRGTVARLLQRHDIEIVSIPSSREAVRRERDIVRLLQRCELVLLLVRQITHSTSDQVRKVAERAGVPVLFSNALSAVAIERQLLAVQE